MLRKTTNGEKGEGLTLKVISEKRGWSRDREAYFYP